MIRETATSTFARFAVYFFIAICLVTLAYYTPRSNFQQLIILYALLFAAYLHILFYWQPAHIKEALYVSIALRALLLFSIPNLSDDVYRFIWDGNLSAHNINPFLQTPEQFMGGSSTHIFDQYPLLYEHLNSKTYFTVYPPLLQFIFYLAHVLSFGNTTLNIIFLKLTIFFSELGTLYFLKNILYRLKLPVKNLLVYALNPLIILELAGNIHFEALMICFLTAAIYFLLTQKYLRSAVFFALAVAAKIWPLMLLPFLIKRLGFKKAGIYGAIVLLVFALLFLPFYTPAAAKDFSTSLNLYFSTFEFNAGLYYLLKWLTAFGYPEKLLIQKLLPAAVVLVILISSFVYRKEKLLPAFLFAFTTYFLFTTTLHPWYITPLIALSVLTGYRFPILWSAFIFTTYITYRDTSYTQNYILITLEYVVVISCLLFELLRRKKDNNIISA